MGWKKTIVPDLTAVAAIAGFLQFFVFRFLLTNKALAVMIKGKVRKKEVKFGDENGCCDY
jgi:hypothetical protein